MQPMENSSTNGKDATPSNMETQNAKKMTNAMESQCMTFA